jgi:hypothetical protein
VISAVPEATPVTIPLVASTVATLVVPEDHEPPDTELLSVVTLPWQTTIVPVIEANEPTVTTTEALQPEPRLYSIVAVPLATVVTSPVVPSTVATAVLELLHEPPVVALDRLVVPPIHTLAVPVIAAGAVLTVTSAEALQPVPAVVNDIIVVPLATPFTMPLVRPTVATLVLLLLHVPEAVLVKVTEEPRHTLSEPMIPDGSALTVTIVDLEQPVASV